MEIFWLIVGGIFIVVGIIGCILPVLPGPPISYLGILVLQITQETPFTLSFMIVWGLITIAVTVLDYFIPAYGTKRFGGSKRGIWGSMIGLLIGIVFFPPLGIIIGPVMGALVGELSLGKKRNEAIKSAFGSFMGFLLGTMLKLTVSGVLGYYYFINI